MRRTAPDDLGGDVHGGLFGAGHDVQVARAALHRPGLSVDAVSAASVRPGDGARDPTRMTAPPVTEGETRTPEFIREWLRR
ncbi:MAG: hypothetical protein JWP64_3956 [Pseudonocardia sp.]|jgi:hypothetical protein|nr:hypothetical protein [Pseudonocardia sp.]MDT7698540.1 hypothetical protein [Pseudonocardiales bacterium]